MSNNQFLTANETISLINDALGFSYTEDNLYELCQFNKLQPLFFHKGYAVDYFNKTPPFEIFQIEGYFSIENLHYALYSDSLETTVGKQIYGKYLNSYTKNLTLLKVNEEPMSFRFLNTDFDYSSFRNDKDSQHIFKNNSKLIFKKQIRFNLKNINEYIQSESQSGNEDNIKIRALKSKIQKLERDIEKLKASKSKTKKHGDEIILYLCHLVKNTAPRFNRSGKVNSKQIGNAINELAQKVKSEDEMYGLNYPEQRLRKVINDFKKTDDLLNNLKN